MKKIYIAMLALAASFSAMAAEDTDSVDTKVIKQVENADQLVITEDSHGVTINILGIGGDADSTYTYRSQFSSDAVVKTHQSSNNWCLSMPFASKYRQNVKYPYWSVESSGLAFGYSMGVNAPSGAGLKGAEIMWTNALALSYRASWRSKFIVGLGLDWRNYRLDDNVRFYRDNASGKLTIGSYADANAYDRLSRIKTFSLLVPLTYQCNLGARFKTSLSAILDFNVYGSVKTKYRIGDMQYEDFNKDIHQNVVTCDFMATVTWGGIMGFYAKYSPCNVLKTDFGPKFQSLSFGTMLLF